MCKCETKLKDISPEAAKVFQEIREEKTANIRRKLDDYTTKIRDSGLERLNVIIPAEDIDKVKAYVRRLRIAAGKPLQTD